MKTKEITPIKYADVRGIKPQYVHKLLKDERLDLLPEIISVKKYSRFYVLIVPDTFSENSFRNIKK